jgi:phage minor structural protein
MSWKEVTLDLSSVADGDKNAIRYIGFKNLTDGEVEVIFDSIRAFDGDIYIESDNASHYKVKKEYVYQHSGKPEKTVFETILYPSHDAYTSSAAPNSNFNSLVMGVQAGTVWNTFLKWDFSTIPADATIEEAVLSLTQYQGSGTLSVATTQLCDADWDETTITYNNQPSTSGASFHTWDFRSIGTVNDSGDILTTVQNWFNSVTDNYGITIRTASGRAEFYSKNVHVDGAKPQLKIKYSLTTDPKEIIKAGAMEKLYANDEPALMYKVKAADLSKVIADTWEEETIELGDTVKIYDYDMKDADGKPLNVNVRVKKITKNLLDPSDMDIELANKAYSITDADAELAKKLSYAMPFADKPNVVSANAVQAGYTGGSVNV